MAIEDLQVFLQERAHVFDETLDVSSGSPFDVQVVQPLLRRIGPDPFTIDFFAFAQARLNQDYPDLATKEGDAITDLLIKMASLLFDPILRENIRVKNSQSFRDATILTTDEAESLGANLFSERNRGSFAKGPVRIYFAQPQSISITPANYITSQTGLHFFPTEIQSIRVDEMLFNQEGTLYYFDVNVIAEKAGDQYNIGPDQVSTIANLEPAVRIINKRRFRFGNPEETAVEFVDRAQQELSERSLVTLRGIGAKITTAFPEITRLAVVGFNDPEMQRDVITGGNLGPTRAIGSLAIGVPDGEGQLLTRRVDMSADAIDFTTLIGSSGTSPTGWVLTVIGGFGSTPPFIRDLPIRSIVSPTQVDLVDQVIVQSLGTNFSWTLRKRELTLSGIPGGILFPDGINGTIAVPEGSIHIGGCTDILVRGTDFDTSSLVLSSVVDDTPVLQGVALQVYVGVQTTVGLGDYVFGVNYFVGDPTYTALGVAQENNYSLQIMEGPAAGSYRILNVFQGVSNGDIPHLVLDPNPLLITGIDFRWRLLDVLDIDLVEPKETRVLGNDLKTVQGVDFVETVTSTNFTILGVSPGDTLRVNAGPDAGDYTVVQVMGSFDDRVQVNRVFTSSRTNLSYSIFRPNAEGGVILPLVRITSIDLLDTSGQPIGATIPYAKPIDARSRTFANVSHGIKVDVRDARLGIVSLALPAIGGGEFGENVNGLGFNLTAGGITTSITFTSPDPVSVETMASDINTQMGKTVAFVVDTKRLGISPLDSGVTTITPGTLDAMAVLFGSMQALNSNDVTSATTNWSNVSPSVEIDQDVLQVLDGYQIGFYNHPIANPFTVSNTLSTDKNFAPEAGRHIQFGSRSIGSARLYFLDPTSIEFDTDAWFSVLLASGITVRFKTDPTLSAQKIPGKPSGITPKDGSTVSSGHVLTTSSLDFTKKMVHPGDQLVISTIPITGSVALADPVVNLASTTFILSVDGGTDKTLIFITDSTSIASTDVTRAGVASQINRAAGRTLCSIVQVGLLFYLEFEADVNITIRATGTANVLLGIPTVTDTNNDSPHRGTYDIDIVTATTLHLVQTLPVASPTPVTRQMFKVFRPGAQRISSTEMVNNLGTSGLYYFDVELVSEGTGDLWNIQADLEMSLTGYDSDGYYLTTTEPNLSFSVVEQLHMILSRTLLQVGVADDPENATQLSGQNIQVNYEYSSLTGAVNNFVLAETERVVNENPLARHLIPYFVRFDLTYQGGSKETVVKPDLETYISELFPSDSLEVSDLEKLVSNRGANSITNPIDLIAVVHNVDRSITVERSQNKLNTGRLAAFIPDVLNIVRRIS